MGSGEPCTCSAALTRSFAIGSRRSKYKGERASPLAKRSAAPSLARRIRQKTKAKNAAAMIPAGHYTSGLRDACRISSKLLPSVHVDWCYSQQPISVGLTSLAHQQAAPAFDPELPQQHQPARARGGDHAAGLIAAAAPTDDRRRRREMPRHRRCHLPQRIGEDVRQHQIERPGARMAALKIRSPGSSAPIALIR